MRGAREGCESREEAVVDRGREALDVDEREEIDGAEFAVERGGGGDVWGDGEVGAEETRGRGAIGERCGGRKDEFWQWGRTKLFRGVGRGQLLIRGVAESGVLRGEGTAADQITRAALVGV